MFAPIGRLFDHLKRRRGPQPVEVLADGEGVSVAFDDGSVLPRFRWAEVTEIRAFKLDLGTWDDIRLAFQTGEYWEEFSEDLKGFGRLSEKMIAAFPGIPWPAPQNLVQS